METVKKSAEYNTTLQFISICRFMNIVAICGLFEQKSAQCRMSAPLKGIEG
jgi:hypothetical protein